MTNTETFSNPTPSQAATIPWWEKAIALIAVINLLLVLFNIAYVPMRDFYLRHVPAIVQVYDPIKGIEPEEFTQNYLHTVDNLETELLTAPEFTPETEQILQKLRYLSAEMIDENPFLAAGKFATFAKIKRLMRQHTNSRSDDAAFTQFWTSDYLTSAGVESELSFFDSKIRPAINTNYFRYVDDYGQFIDDFWRIDVFFVGFFAIEYISRSFLMSLRQPKVHLLDAMLRHWYDVFMLFPVWRWLRIIPVMVKVHKSKLVNTERVLAQITHEPAAYLSDRISQFVLVRIINQAKDSVVQGELARSLLYPQPYKAVNDINEIEVITDKILNLTIYKVLPKVQPELEELLHYSLRNAFQDSDFYQTMQKVPGLGNLPAEVLENLANQLAEAAVDVLASSYADVEGRQLFDRFSHDFSRALRNELRNKETLAELELLLSDLLEEIKLNYVVSSAKTDPTETMEEVEKIVENTENKQAN
ncbi:MAG: hypothetical protein SAL07_05155 [Oscillatoria sp. PMC 1051.18]|nr:hypothetical protein [Oscillatoria sp. PMC 1050.18]MEC5029281.1 hypothetical protein [Oscillatoria sp. PMC 1051.18]